MLQLLIKEQFMKCEGAFVSVYLDWSESLWVHGVLAKGNFVNCTFFQFFLNYKDSSMEIQYVKMCE